MLDTRLTHWLLRDQGHDAQPVVLRQRRIYILPTRAGLLLGLTLVLMLLGCINYNLSLGYILTFLLVGVGIVSMLHTFRNLAGLRLQAGRAHSVFLGETAAFPIVIDNPTNLARCAISLELEESLAGELHSEASAPVWCDVGASSTVTVTIRIEPIRRGRLRLPRLRVHTTFPLGMFYAWSYMSLDVTCLVYPRPETARVPLPPPQSGEDDGTPLGNGQDDFAGFRTYHRGDSLRHVAWKAAARGQGMLTKHFSGPALGTIWLGWHGLPSQLGLEARVSRLTRWVLEASGAGLTYGLELPGMTLAPASGVVHEQSCLAALALLKADAGGHDTR